MRDDYVRPQRDQFFRERLKSVRLALAKAIVHPQIAPIRPTKPFKSLPQTRKACLQVPIAFFAREDSRAKAPAALHAAVRKAGGDVSSEESVKPWELPKWVIAQARELNLILQPDAARALIQHVGDRQQRLLRELEKLAIGAGEPGIGLR